MGRYVEDDLLEAEEMFERLIGYQFAKSIYNEVHAFTKQTGHQIKTKNFPLDILKCEGYLKFDQMMFEGWVEIPIETVCMIGQVLDIPPSIFLVPYEKIRVEYLAGTDEIPEEICNAIREIADHLEDENTNSWNLPLSSDTLKVISKYKK